MAKSKILYPRKTMKKVPVVATTGPTFRACGERGNDAEDINGFLNDGSGDIAHNKLVLTDGRWILFFNAPASAKTYTLRVEGLNKPNGDPEKPRTAEVTIKAGHQEFGPQIVTPGDGDTITSGTVIATGSSTDEANPITGTLSNATLGVSKSGTTLIEPFDPPQPSGGLWCIRFTEVPDGDGFKLEVNQNGNKVSITINIDTAGPENPPPPP